MKKQLLLVAALSVLIWNPLAEASRSRLNAVGQGANGSLYIQDARNIFLNPAQINNTKQQANMEWGATASNTTPPKAEGGLVHGMSGMNLGLQLGRVGEAAGDVTSGVAFSGLALTPYPQNSIDLIVGGSGGMNWGGALHYVNNDSKTSSAASPDTESQIITGKFGVVMGEIQGYLHADVTNNTKSETSGVTTEYKGQMTLRAGGSYDMGNDSMLGLHIDRQGYDFDDNAGNKGEGSDFYMEFTYHRNVKKTETDMLYYSFGVIKDDDEAKYDTGGVSKTFEKLALPIKIGVETKARDWMVLRGSVTQEVIINKHESKTTAGATTETNNSDDTTVAAGIGFIFNENLTMDATFKGSVNGDFDATNMFGNIGMNYTF